MKLKRQNNLTTGPKKSKTMTIKIQIRNTKSILIVGWNWNEKSTSQKAQQNKIQKNKDQIRKNNYFFFTKESRPKIRNQKNKNLSENLHKLEDNSETLHGQHKFRGDKREKRGEKSIVDEKPCHHWSHTLPQKEEDTSTLLMTRWNGDFGY